MIRVRFRGRFSAADLRAFLAGDQQPIVIGGEIVGYSNDIGAALEMARQRGPRVARLKGEIIEVDCRGEIIETAAFVEWRDGN